MNIEPNVIGNQPRKILTIPFETEKQLQKLTIRTLMKHPEKAQKSQPNPRNFTTQIRNKLHRKTTHKPINIAPPNTKNKIEREEKHINGSFGLREKERE